MADGYWDSRYSQPVSTGASTSGLAREWMWRVLSAYVGEIDDVVDVGCGDLLFVDDHNFRRYIGIDVSESVVARNRRHRPEWNFIASSSSTRQDVNARIVLCIEMLYHVMDESEYVSTIDNLAAYADEWLFVSTWRRNPFTSLRACLVSCLSRLAGDHRLQGVFDEITKFINQRRRHMDSDGVYRRFRRLEDEMARIETSGLRLVSIRICPYNLGLTGLYVFHRDNVR